MQMERKLSTRASRANNARPRAVRLIGMAAFLLLSQVFFASELLNRSLLEQESRNEWQPPSHQGTLSKPAFENHESRKGGKESSNPDDEFRLAKFLHDAGLTAVENEKLPRWKDVNELYGSEPIIYGKETCARFRHEIPVVKRWIAVAGMFNSGTNLLSDYMGKSCKLPSLNGRIRGNLWQVPWGKHMLAEYKDKNVLKFYERYNKTDTLPVVIIRDPYNWQQSMCSHPYDAKWKHSQERCPNLIANELDSGENGAPIPAQIRFTPSITVKFPSLAHIWSEYYTQYDRVDYPRLMVRYEDLLFYPKIVMRDICECAGGFFTDTNFSIKVDNAKFGPGHGEQKPDHGLLTAILKNTDFSRRTKGLTNEDLLYSYTAFDSTLMQKFHYKRP